MVADVSVFSNYTISFGVLVDNIKAILIAILETRFGCADRNGISTTSIKKAESILAYKEAEK